MVLIAKDVVESDLLSLSTDVDAFEAAKRMKASRHGFVVVTSASGEAVGIVTEWDYVSKIVSEAKNPQDVKLGDIMSTNLVTAKASEGFDAVAKLMAERGVRRILVTTDDGKKIIGVITARTILKNLEDYVNKVSADIARLQSPQL
jgi:malate dehydrogenase (oxaloacetate-decarboxylating)